MKPILRAFGRTIKSLFTAGVLWHLIWPSLLAVALWCGVAYFAWGPVTLFLEESLKHFSWIEHYAGQNPGLWSIVRLIISANVAVFLLLLIYATSIILVASFALPLIVDKVSRKNYQDLELRQGGSMLGSAGNTLWAFFVFVLLLLVTLPLWLIPGAGLVILVLLTGWLNARTFGYDAIMLHADKEERKTVLKAEHSTLMLLGCLCALLTYVPIVNILSTAFCALAFTHYLLDTLRASRTAKSPVPMAVSERSEGAQVLEPVSGPDALASPAPTTGGITL